MHTHTHTPVLLGASQAHTHTHTPTPILLGTPQTHTRTHTHPHPDPARCPTGCLSKQHRAKPLGTDGSIGWWTDLQSYKKTSTTHGSSGKLPVFKWSVHLLSSLQSQPERSPAPTATEMLPLSFVAGLWTSPRPVRAPPELTIASDVFCWGSLNFSWTSAGAPWADFSFWCLLLGVSELLPDWCGCPWADLNLHSGVMQLCADGSECESALWFRTFKGLGL